MDNLALKIKNLTVSYGSIKALKGIDIEIIPENVFYEMLGVDD